MIADAPVVVAPSRRWGIALSLALHAIAIGLLASPHYRVKRLPYRRPEIVFADPAPPLPPSDDRCVAWVHRGCVVECAAWRRSSEPVGCPDGPPLPPPGRASRIVDDNVLAPDGGLGTEHGVLEVCVAADGHVLSALPLRSTTDACRDLELARRALHWHYAPMTESACGEVRL